MAAGSKNRGKFYMIAYDVGGRERGGNGYIIYKWDGGGGGGGAVAQSSTHSY